MDDRIQSMCFIHGTKTNIVGYWYAVTSEFLFLINPNPQHKFILIYACVCGRNYL